jgi:hypothetical protein
MKINYGSKCGNERKAYKWVTWFQGEEQCCWCSFWVSKNVESNDIEEQINEAIWDISKMSTDEIWFDEMIASPGKKFWEAGELHY